MGKTYTVKTPPGDFKVTTPENPLLSQQVVISKGISVLYTNLQLNSYPDTQLNLFCSDNFSFWCTTPSTWLTNCADSSTRLQSPTKKVVGYKVLQFIHNEDPEDAWSQNPTVHKHSNFFRRDELGRNFVFGYKLLEQTLLNTCASCVPFDGP